MKKIKNVDTRTEGVSIYDTGIPGPTVGIIGGVHGNERAGMTIVRRIKLKGYGIHLGKLILIEGNPCAIKEKVRFTETNLNRKFRKLNEIESKMGDDLPYETVRAQELLPFLDECEALLDLHEHYSPELGSFIICEKPSYDVARRIGAPIISSGWSTAEAGGTDGYMAKNNKPGICFELGYLKNTEKNVKLGLKVVNRFLSAYGMIKPESRPLFPEKKTKYVQALYSHIRRDKQFKLSRQFKSFESLSEGELIAQDGNKKVFAGKDEIIIFPREDDPIGTEAFTVGQSID